MSKINQILNTIKNKLTHKEKPKKKPLTGYQLLQKYPDIPAYQALSKDE